MIRSSCLGGLPRAAESGPCSGPYGQRITWMEGGVRVVVPDMIADRNMRWLVDQGMSLENAYRQVGYWGDFFPSPGLEECMYQTLKVKII